LENEIVLVDDASTDGTSDVLRKLQQVGGVKIISHPVNRGKGAALRTALEHATGDIILIQDADLEYDPSDYPNLLRPILDHRADVVYGSRFTGGTHRVLLFWHYMANRLLTLLSNMLCNLNLTDMETCYKVFRRQCVEGMKLTSDRFGIEPELTAKLARRRYPSTKPASIMPAAITPKARKSTGKTASPPSGSFSATGFSTDDGGRIGGSSSGLRMRKFS
jgi:glycosyltransferase involved in cell wall biosynthesis